MGKILGESGAHVQSVLAVDLDIDQSYVMDNGRKGGFVYVLDLV